MLQRVFLMLLGGMVVVVTVPVLPKIVAAEASLDSKLLIGLPVLFLASYGVLFFLFNQQGEFDEGPPFWVGRRYGAGMNLPNPAHPAGRFAALYLVLLLLVWLAAFEDHFRHDFTHLFQALGVAAPDRGRL